ncbi:uncharacterized protein HD556DRAFT_1306727 [Suillus plorans]|uniref:Uncharacterized protein n=1 Tax=Suillus plorans TaxID=116603 RepID=A0A9P7IYG6_9AGAM|nr:uncharacterized protein HD556DRAFT_1306727 [Suillus plorans]KAG1797027.1 hypothetical protein HD556DRAFT_1306727 [Suillus plorans]
MDSRCTRWNENCDVFIQSLISLLGAVDYPNFNDWVGKRELRVPMSSPAAGGMLKSLLMRRQSSQASGMVPSQVSMDNDIGVMASFPLSSHEAVYGDTSQDARNEIIFSI